MASETVERKLAAILSADVAGYSRLMGEDEEGTLTAFKAHRAEAVDPAIARHHGRIVKTTGDGLLAEFASAVDAVRCALAMQEAMAARNATVADDQKIEFRVGVNVGDVMIDGDDLMGDGVNVAARLQEIAEPGGVSISRTARDQVRDKLELTLEDLGEQTVKNIARPVRVFRVPVMTENAHATGEVPSNAAGLSGTELELPDKPSIVVLPFENMSGDPEQEYFADGIAEDIITGLSKMRWVFVISRNSAFTYKGKAVDVKQVAKELGVSYALEGSVRKAGNRVRITAQLIDALSDHHVWAERYDRELEDIFAVQDEITQNIVAAVAPEFVAAEIERAQRKDPRDLRAWDCTMRAHWHMERFSKEDFAEARGLIQRAVELDPNNAWPLGDLAVISAFEAILGWHESREQGLAEAAKAARRAVALDGQDARAHAALAFAYFFAQEHHKAIPAARTAVDLDPNYALAYSTLGSALGFAGETDEAWEYFERGMRLSPREPFLLLLSWMGMSGTCFVAERYDEAVEWAHKVTENRPDFPVGYRQKAGACAAAGRLDEARSAVQELLRLIPDLTLTFMAENKGQVPFARAEDRERYLDALRKAGLPE